MKLLLDIGTPAGFQNLHGQEPAVETEIAAFVKRLIVSRTRGPEPTVTVVCLGDNDVCVDADALLRLQTKAGAK